MTTNPLPVRTALDLLRHWTSRSTASPCRPLGTRCFTSLKPPAPHVQPRFAQAGTTGLLRAKLSLSMLEFNPAQPSIPRVWDVLLGGKDNFTADRDQAQKLLAVF